jgi:NADH-quinone oxidoreductase subunit D
MREMVESIRILRQALAGIPEGPVIARVARNFKPPVGDVHVKIEAPRGEQSWYVSSDGSEYPHRVHIRTGSFTAMGIIDRLSRGLMIADLVAVIASMDIVAPEVDR